MFDYSPEYAFDGVVDLWFNKRMPDQYKAEAISIYESFDLEVNVVAKKDCLLYTSPSPRDRTRSRMPSSA